MLRVSIIPSHDIAVWLLTNIDGFMDLIGLKKHHALEQLIYFIVILVGALCIGWILKRIILWVVRSLVRHHGSQIGRQLLDMRVFSKCSHIIPPIVFMSFAPFAFESSSPMLTMILRISGAYTCLAAAVGICAILSFIFARYNEKENKRNLPIRGVLNTAQGLVWMVLIIIAVSIIVHKSPAALLGGLTAFAAALMLIFKDSILGFVAGLQMSKNDMLHVGDWIVVPGTPANGTVEDVSLTTVKVRNFDNTIVTVPPYTLVSSSFQNWRGMSESGVRRVSMNIYINPDTIKAPDQQMLDTLGEKYPKIKAFVDELRASGKTVAWKAGNAPLNGTIETNIGLFRAYLIGYLIDNEMVDDKADLMVNIAETSHEGVAMQIYCFSVTTQWEQYEGVLSAIIEHALLKAPEFDLEILSADHLNVDTK